MNWDLVNSVWPVLAVMMALLLVTISKILGAQRKHEIEVYDRVLAAKELRRQYSEAVKERQSQL